MLFRIYSYLCYLFRSVNLHGIHSPFVFSLVKDCIYDKKRYPAYDVICKYIRQLSSDEETIDFVDHGAGNRSGSVQVSSIASRSSSRVKKSALLLRLAQYFNPSTILELGTNLGVGTMALSLGSPGSKVVTIEGSPALSKKASEGLKDLHNVEFICDTFDNALPGILKEYRPEMVFIDGNHTYEATIKYFDILTSYAGNNTVLIFDDIYWSDGMKRAFNEIVRDPRVTVSVDLYMVGLIFFRKGQVKEHFTVRF